MEYFSAILLFDAFSARKMERFRHWIIVTSLAFLEATLLNFAAITMPNYSKIVIGLVLLFSLHRFLYTSNRMFSFYISVIFYTTLEKYHTLYAMDYENGWFEFATELPNTLIS